MRARTLACLGEDTAPPPGQTGAFKLQAQPFPTEMTLPRDLPLLKVLHLELSGFPSHFQNKFY